MSATPGPYTRMGNSICAYGHTDTFDGSILGPIGRVDDLETTDCEGRTWSTSGNKEDNLNLFVAAPALRDALRAILNNFDDATLADGAIPEITAAFDALNGLD